MSLGELRRVNVVLGEVPHLLDELPLLGIPSRVPRLLDTLWSAVELAPLHFGMVYGVLDPL